MSAGETRTGSSVAGGRSLVAFEGFLKKAGRLVGVVLVDIARLALPIASLIGAMTPNMSAAEGAFLASVQLIGDAVLAIEQKWSVLGPEGDGQRLSDVLAIVEQPVMALFAEAGIAVDAAYVLNLVNGIVALLNAQPGDALGPLAVKAA